MDEERDILCNYIATMDFCCFVRQLKRLVSEFRPIYTVRWFKCTLLLLFRNNG